MLVHADWSTDPKKRWLCRAETTHYGYTIAMPEPVGSLNDLFERCKATAPDQAILFGFDFPIGLPKAYAQRAGIVDFREALLDFSAEFYQPARTAEELSLDRPFYPNKPGSASKRQLWGGLQFASATDLLRVCERATATRRAACELFWTLGAKQVGKAAICGWRDLLTPALRDKKVKLWPFEGELAPLLRQPNLIVAESYPAETYRHLGFPKSFSKRSQEGRASQAEKILHWRQANQVVLESRLQDEIRQGFGNARYADDRFDSFIGVLGLIEVAMNPQAFAAPNDPVIQSIEGWILGMR